MKSYPLPQVVSEDIEKFVSGIMDRRRLESMYQRILEALETEGAFVEIGTGEGLTSAFIRYCLDSVFGSGRALHVYDAFPVHDLIKNPCLPPPPTEECDVDGGISKIENTFSRLNLEAPEIHPGWFVDTLSTQLPASVAFAHIDCNLYESNMAALMNVYPRLSVGGICMIDDYGLGYFPCVQKAVDEFMTGKPEKLEKTVNEIQAAFKKVALVEEVVEQVAPQEELPVLAEVVAPPKEETALPPAKTAKTSKNNSRGRYV